MTLRIKWSMLLAMVTVAGGAVAQEKAERAGQLQKALKRFPDADTNKDGKLTDQEAREYLRKNPKAKAKQGDSKRADGAGIKPTHADVAYGPAPRNVLDFYQAKSEKPTPLIIFIHGGGFVGGDKRQINPPILRGALDSGISCAAIHYRFVNGQDVIFPTPQRDSARAVQFLREKAKDWNIDPKRVACFGGSAGAGISMWLGFHDDLADPKSDDPVLRQSTRITAIGTFGGQSTYDPIKIKELIGGRAWEHRSLQLIYGLGSTAEALKPTAEQQKLYDEGSAITHLTKDDPPLFMVYIEPEGPVPPDARPGAFIHHPNFGKHLEREMNKLGIENVYVHTSRTRNADEQMLEFFKKHFGMKSGS